MTHEVERCSLALSGAAGPAGGWTAAWLACAKASPVSTFAGGHRREPASPFSWAVKADSVQGSLVAAAP